MIVYGISVNGSLLFGWSCRCPWSERLPVVFGCFFYLFTSLLLLLVILRTLMTVNETVAMVVIINNNSLILTIPITVVVVVTYLVGLLPHEEQRPTTTLPGHPTLDCLFEILPGVSASMHYCLA